jgi:hypothetical protein
VGDILAFENSLRQQRQATPLTKRLRSPFGPSFTCSLGRQSIVRIGLGFGRHATNWASQVTSHQTAIQTLISWNGCWFVVGFAQTVLATKPACGVSGRQKMAGLTASRNIEDAMNRMIPLATAMALAAATVIPNLALADPVATEATQENDGWQFGGLIYFYYADIGTKATLPNGATSTVAVDASDLVNNLKFGFLGSFEARKDSWGVFSDLIYMDVGQFKSQFHELTIGNIGLPADVSASVNFDLKSIVWTVAGTYRAVDHQDAVLDVVGGARLLDTKVSLDYTLNGNIGPIAAPERAGTSEAKEHFIDGIVGLKGRLAFGTDGKWFVPYYGDVGTGQSQLTWQVMSGLGYAFKWGELIGAWRYVDYKFKSDSAIDSESFNGPMLGAAFHW